MRPDACPVCDHGATDAASIRVHNIQAASTGCRVYPFGRGTQRPVAIPKPERPAEWLNREFGAFAPALLGRVGPGEM